MIHPTIQNNPALLLSANTLVNLKTGSPVFIDLRKIPGLTYDFLFICTCQTQVQMRSALTKTQRALRGIGISHSRLECAPGARWGILDCGDFVVHIFEQNTRSFYALERLWVDAEFTELLGSDFIQETLEISDEDGYL